MAVTLIDGKIVKQLKLKMTATDRLRILTGLGEMQIKVNKQVTSTGLEEAKIHSADHG